MAARPALQQTPNHVGADAWHDLHEVADTLRQLLGELQRQTMAIHASGGDVGVIALAMQQHFLTALPSPASPCRSASERAPFPDLDRDMGMNDDRPDPTDGPDANQSNSPDPGPLFPMRDQGPAQAALPSLAWLRHFKRIIDQRHDVLDRDLIADPCWDMLLDLCIAEASGKQVSVTSLCIASRVSPTTALRWIDIMTQRGWFRRHKDEADKRRTFVFLTDKARTQLISYFGSM